MILKSGYSHLATMTGTPHRVSLCGIVSIGMGSSASASPSTSPSAESRFAPCLFAVVFLALFAANEFSFQRVCNWLKEERLAGRLEEDPIYCPIYKTLTGSINHKNICARCLADKTLDHTKQ